MPKILLTLALLSLAFAAPASAGFRGYLPPEYKVWIADAATRMPMPQGVTRISGEDCWPDGGQCYEVAERTVYTADESGWHVVERHFGLLHELGHAYDFQMRPLSRRKAMRLTFMRALGLHRRWVGNGGPNAPAEKFAEQYAACAVGIPREIITQAYALSGFAVDPLTGGDLSYARIYVYEPPPWISHEQMCGLVRAMR